MVCLFPMSERTSTEPRVHHCSSILRLCRLRGYARYEILAQWEAQAKEEIRCRAATGPFGPHYNGSISSFSPLWIAAALTMNKGCRPASCQAVSTPFSATLWPTPRSLLRLHCVEERFCGGQHRTEDSPIFIFMTFSHWVRVGLGLRRFKLDLWCE